MPVCSQPLPARGHPPCLSALPTPPGHTRGDGSTAGGCRAASGPPREVRRGLLLRRSPRPDGSGAAQELGGCCGPAGQDAPGDTPPTPGQTARLRRLGPTRPSSARLGPARRVRLGAAGPGAAARSVCGRAAGGRQTIAAAETPAIYHGNKICTVMWSNCSFRFQRELKAGKSRLESSKL